MISHAYTRRGALSAIAMTSAAVATVAVPAVAQVTASKFDAALAEHKAAVGASDHHFEHVYSPVMRRVEGLEAAVPHETIQWEPNPSFAGETWTTADRDRIRQARYFLDPSHKLEVDPCAASYHKAALLLVAADDRRIAAFQAIAEDAGIDALTDESDRISAAACEAAWAVINCPVASNAELARKIEFITSEDVWDAPAAQQALAADAKRLAGAPA